VILPKSFYNASTVRVAQRLLGCFLVHDSPQGRTTGRIVETEAYLAEGDPACHASRGKTKRNAPMFGPPGRSYIYFIYGMYYCFNVVTGAEDRGEAVLIRALEPVAGLDLMAQRRHTSNVHQMCSGPAKLVLAMGITPQLNNTCLRTSALRVFSPDSFKREYQKPRTTPIVRAPRVGIACAKDLPLRFFLKDSEFVSRR